MSRVWRREQVLVDLLFLCCFVIALIRIWHFDFSVADYRDYWHFYQISPVYTYRSLQMEPAMLFLAQLFLSLGLQWNHLLVCLEAAGLLLLWSLARRYADNAAWVLLAYALFPFALDQIQIRNFLAYALVLYGCRFLIEEGRTWGGKGKFLFFVLLACGFHFTALAYLPLLFTVLPEDKFLAFVPLAGTAALLLLLLLLDRVSTLDRYQKYIDSLGMNVKNGFFMAAFVIMNVVMVRLILRRKREWSAYDVWFSRVNVLSLFYLVLIWIMGNNFYRFFRNLLPLYYIEMSRLHVSPVEDRNRGSLEWPLALLKFLYPAVFLAAFGLHEIGKG